MSRSGHWRGCGNTHWAMGQKILVSECRERIRRRGDRHIASRRRASDLVSSQRHRSKVVLLSYTTHRKGSALWQRLQLDSREEKTKKNAGTCLLFRLGINCLFHVEVMINFDHTIIHLIYMNNPSLPREETVVIRRILITYRP